MFHHHQHHYYTYIDGWWMVGWSASDVCFTRLVQNIWGMGSVSRSSVQTRHCAALVMEGRWLLECSKKSQPTQCRGMGDLGCFWANWITNCTLNQRSTKLFSENFILEIIVIHRDFFHALQFILNSHQTIKL